MSLKIAHIFTRFLRGGSEENTLAMALPHAAAGNDVHFIVGAEFDQSFVDELSEHFSFHFVPSMVHQISPVDDFRAIVDVTALLRQIRADVVHTHQSKAGIVGRISARLVRTPAIVHGIHIVPFEGVNSLRALMYKMLEAAIAPITDMFFDVSPGSRDLYLRAGIGSTTNHHIIRSGMDLSRFKSRNDAASAAVRTALGVCEGEVLVCMVAAFEQRKRHIWLFEAMASYVNELRGLVRLVCVGQGPQFQAAQDVAHSLGIADIVSFTGYSRRPEDFIHAADICLLSSHQEGLPRVVIQYAAAGKPIVVSHVAGYDGFLQDNNSAIILREEDDDGLIVALIQLAKSVERRRQLSYAASSIDLSDWDSFRISSKVMDLYIHALTSKGYFQRSLWPAPG